MIKRSVAELQFVRSREPLATVEIDLDSIPPTHSGYGGLVEHALTRLAGEHPAMRATVYVSHCMSYSFGAPGSSAFFAVAGDKKVLPALEAAFRGARGTHVRYSDFILSSQGICQYHIEDGRFWRVFEEGVWYSDEPAESVLSATDSDNEAIGSDDDAWDDAAESDVEEDEEDDQSDHGTADGNNGGRSSIPSRFRAARSDASVASIRSAIESVFGLPEGSVALRGPDGKNIKGNASIRTLRKRWE